MFWRLAASYQMITGSYNLAIDEETRMKDGYDCYTKEEIIAKLRGSLIISEDSMKQAIEMVKYSNSVHVILSTHQFASPSKSTEAGSSSVFYSDLSDTTLKDEKVKLFSKHINNIFTTLHKYNQKQVS